MKNQQGSMENPSQQPTQEEGESDRSYAVEKRPQQPKTGNARGDMKSSRGQAPKKPSPPSEGRNNQGTSRG